MPTGRGAAQANLMVPVSRAGGERAGSTSSWRGSRATGRCCRRRCSSTATGCGWPRGHARPSRRTTGLRRTRWRIRAWACTRRREDLAPGDHGPAPRASSRSWRSSRRWTGTSSASTRRIDPDLGAVLAHNRDEETEHAAMSLEWLRRQDPVLDEHLREYLFTQGSIVALEAEIEGGDGDGRRRGLERRQPGHRQPAGCAVNHLHRELAPIDDAAWGEIEDEARRTLRHFLTARKVVDFSGPHGWDHSALGLGRVADGGDAPGRGRRGPASAWCSRSPSCARSSRWSARRSTPSSAAPRTPTGTRWSTPPAGRRWPRTGWSSAASPPRAFAGSSRPRRTTRSRSTPTYDHYPTYVAMAVETLKRAGVAGPYAIAAGPALLHGRDRDDRARRLPGAGAPAPDRRGAGAVGARRSTARWS